MAGVGGSVVVAEFEGRSGIDWEVPDPDDAWSNIGYWGDHQIVYLLRLLEASQRFHPGVLQAALHREVYSYADVIKRLNKNMHGDDEGWHKLPDDRELVADPRSAYQVVSMLQGVVQRGTGKKIGRAVDKPLAGKTGTTNDSLDTWFIGFSPDLAVGVFVGFSSIQQTLGFQLQDKLSLTGIETAQLTGAARGTRCSARRC